MSIILARRINHRELVLWLVQFTQCCGHWQQLEVARSFLYVSQLNFSPNGTRHNLGRQRGQQLPFPPKPPHTYSLPHDKPRRFLAAREPSGRRACPNCRNSAPIVLIWALGGASWSAPTLAACCAVVPQPPRRVPGSCRVVTGWLKFLGEQTSSETSQLCLACARLA